MKISSLSVENYKLCIVCIFLKHENNFLQSCSLMLPSVKASSSSIKIQRSVFIRQVNKQLVISSAKKKKIEIASIFLLLEICQVCRKSSVLRRKHTNSLKWRTAIHELQLLSHHPFLLGDICLLLLLFVKFVNYPGILGNRLFLWIN